uniref:Hemerythrin-like domain-containing protein n=1 Tax=Candidatus Kentrum sp. FM TaxID=2126340 RepID=A0A450T3T5_9GAMM|nr:MAG: Hemerythrin-like domain-containing protein [Candidatus Kentron sp. FM]VFJ61382.1 MAG: Hemerythrin-like domain-containing protein [Candidatus Kentron sp. FM]VFK13454.1 MAG: Hemerythrin-like domain-containing protein [Candidatus Kentron sp. FM]
MSEMIQQLHTDHVNMARLLDLIAEQLELLQVGEVPDYVLMMDIMQYMTNYPDLFHHPKEDILFQRVTKRDKGTHSIVAELVQDHHTLADQGKALFNLLHTLIHEHPVERGTLETKAREYILTLRTHMNLEEGKLFPIAKKVLQDEDRSEIESIMGNREDPLFGENIVEAEYLALYEYIRNHE